MNYTEFEYIQAGFMYEKAKTVESARARLELIRHMVESETIEDRSEARYLVERGRQEAK